MYIDSRVAESPLRAGSQFARLSQFATFIGGGA